MCEMHCHDGLILAVLNFIAWCIVLFGEFVKAPIPIYGTPKEYGIKRFGMWDDDKPMKWN